MSPDYEALVEYAISLGMDPVSDQEFMFIAKQGLLAPLPYPWEVHKGGDNDPIMYVNTQTN